MHSDASARPVDGRRDLALLFPGQGAQHANMAVRLYQDLPDFRDRIDEVLDRWGGEGAAIRRDWRSDTPEIPLDDARRAQPLLFAINWALGRLMFDWGARPAAMLGHSVGELAAATLAGVFTLDDAVSIMADRVAQVAAAPPGAMLAVHATAAEMAPYLGGDVVVGAVNGPKQVVLTGPAEPITAVERSLRDDAFVVLRTRAVNPFHSPALSAVAARGASVVASTRRRPPRVTLYSGYAGGLLTREKAQDIWFWAAQLAAPVHFWPALDAMLSDRDWVVAEAGPGQSLTTLVRQHRSVLRKDSTVVSLLPSRPKRAGGDLDALRAAVAVLRDEGVFTSGRESATSPTPGAVARIGTTMAPRL